MKKYALAVVLGLLFVAVAFEVGAFAPGDELAPGENTSVYLNPADSFNGNQYVELNGEGELEVTVSGLPTNSTTRLDTLFFASFSGLAESDDNVKIWFPHNDDGVTVYHNTSGQPVESEASAVRLEPGESAPFGLLIESSESAPAVETLQIRVTTVEPVETPTPTPSPTPSPIPSPTPTPSPTPSSTPSPTPTGGTETPETPTQTPDDTETPATGGPDSGDETPIPEWIVSNWRFVFSVGAVSSLTIGLFLIARRYGIG